MTINVSGPDGVSVSFPDGTDTSIINDVMTKHFGGGASAQPKSPPAFGSDEYVSALAAKHGADPKFVRSLMENQTGLEIMRGVPIAGGAFDKAGSYVQAAAGAGVPGATLSERASKNLALDQDLAQDYQKAHPIASTAAGLFGGVAATAPVGATALGARALGLGARTLPGQMAAGAASGATINAADALVRGNDPATSAMIGGGFGAVAPPLARGIGAAVSPVVSTLRGIANPTQEAARRVGTAIEHDVAAGGGLTQPEFNTAAAGGTPVNLMDLGGETTRALARSAANTSPEGRELLNRAIDDRFETQAPRLAQDLNSTLNYPTEAARNQAITQVRQTVYEPRYAQAYRDSATTLLWPDRDLMRGLPPDQQAAMRSLEQIAQAPEVQTAIRIATPQLRNWAVRDGLQPPIGAFAIDTSGSAPRTVLQQTSTGNTVLPSLQYWDYVKRALDSMETPTARQFAGVLRNELDTLAPTYRAAREAAQPTKFFQGAPNAFEAGRGFINQGQRYGADAQTQIARMTPEERNLFQDGYTTALVERIEKMPDRRNVVNNVYNSTAARGEIQTALGTQRANELEARLRVEGIMDDARRAVQGNSTTIRQLAELGLAGAGSAFLGGGNPLSGDPSALVNAALVYGTMRGGRAGLATVDQRVATQVARLLTSNNPAHARMGMNLLGRNPGLMGNLRRADVALARAAAVQAQPDQRRQ